MSARSIVPEITPEMAAKAPIGVSVQSPPKTPRRGMLQRHFSQRHEKTKLLDSIRRPIGVEDDKSATTLAAATIGSATDSLNNSALMTLTEEATTAATEPTPSLSKATRAGMGLSKFSSRFLLSRQVSDLSTGGDIATAPATSEARRFWPRRLFVMTKVTPALLHSSSSKTISDSSIQEDSTPVEEASETSNGKCEVLRGPQCHGNIESVLIDESDPTAAASATSEGVRSRPGDKMDPVRQVSDMAAPLHDSQHGSDNGAIPLDVNNPPNTPDYVLQRFANELTELEKTEISEYASIYFFSTLSVKTKRPSEHTRGRHTNVAYDHGSTHSVPSSQAEPRTGEAAKSHEPVCHFNHGYDNERGDYHVLVHDHLAYRYEILHELGTGSFGQVVCCLDRKTQLKVAVKIIRNRERYREQALIEMKILTRLQRSAAAGRQVTNARRGSQAFRIPHFVKMHGYFFFRGHMCIVFELLGMSLHQYLKVRFFEGLPLSDIRNFAVQLVGTLRFLKSQHVIHCDVKLENILIKPTESLQQTSSELPHVTAAHTSMRSKEVCLIDFGSSCFDTNAVFTYVQSRYYRSPEVILGFPYTFAIDMWSLGCILVELHTGYPLFAGENEKDQLACIMELLGTPPNDFLANSRRRKLFFTDCLSGGVAAGTPVTFHPKLVMNSRGRKHIPSSRTLASAVKSNDQEFLDFISKCLEMEPGKRMTPDEAAQHPWLYTPISTEDDSNVNDDTDASNSAGISGSQDNTEL